MERRYFVIYKPYEMISQFVSPYEQRLLGDLDYPFPEGTHAVGRLDYHSEGLLILTTDKSLTRKLLHPSKGHFRKYLVLVKGIVGQEALENLRSGINIGVKGKGFYQTQNCDVQVLENFEFPEREPSLLLYGPHTWLQFTLTEGKNKQIRKMCKAVHHQCKRLIRTEIEDLTIAGMQAGQVKEISETDLMRLLKINPLVSIP